MQYFKHMSNMRHDLKIMKLIKKYGLKGYGLYNIILESITEKLCNEHPLPNMEANCDDIADLYNENSTEINEIACYMMNIGLLEVDEITTQITCRKIYKFLESSQTRSKKIRGLIASYKKRFAEMSENVTDIHDNCNKKMIEQEQEQEQEKNKKRIRIEEDIESIYNSYPSKCPVGNRTTAKGFKCKKKIAIVLKSFSKDLIINSIEGYIDESKKTKTFIKNFETFLNNFDAYVTSEAPEWQQEFDI